MAWERKVTSNAAEQSFGEAGLGRNGYTATAGLSKPAAGESVTAKEKFERRRGAASDDWRVTDGNNPPKKK